MDDHATHTHPVANHAADATVPPASADTTDQWIDVFHRARLPRAEYRFYRGLLLAFLEHGTPPDQPALTRLAHDYGVPLEATLTLLAREDCVQRDPTTGAIRAAYPFSGVPTSHRVTLPSSRGAAQPTQLYAMCALDALGMPLMLRRSAVITSADALTGDAVRVTVAPTPAADEPAHPDAGVDGWTATWEPPTSVVFARDVDYDRAGDTSGTCCPVINFFTTPAHARDWVAAHGSPEGELLTQAEAMQRAHTLFAGILNRLSDDEA